MKKITLVIFAFLLSFSAFAQFPEGFEGTWTTGSGPAGWAIINEAGPIQTWRQQANIDAYPSHTGDYAAFINRENNANTPSDWLITPQFTVPANAQLKFWSRLTIDGDQGTVYKIFIGNSTTDITQFTELQSWTETELNTVQDQYELKQVSIPASYTGQTLRIAFVMRGINGDRWLIDDVDMVSQCFDPTTLGVTNVTGTSAGLTWTDVAGSGAWEVELIPSTATPTGTGVNYTGGQPYPVTGLDPSTSYSFYVRSKCQPDGNNSAWVGPYTFSTTQVPAELNWSTDFESASIGFSIVNGSQTNKWVVGTAVSNTPTHSLYISNDNGATNSYNNASSSVVHAYRDVLIPATATSMYVNYDWRNVGETGWDYIRLWSTPASYTPVAGTQTTTTNANYINHSGNLVGSSATNWTTNGHIIDVTAYQGTVRRFIFEWRNDGSGGSNPPGAIDNVGFTLITCPQPTGLTSTALNMTTADLAWTEAGSATSWQVYVVPAAAAAPTSSTSGTTVSGTAAYTATDLLPGTAYKYYVRSVCGDDEYSIWSGPYNFNTQLCNAVDQCTYTFNLVDSFGDGWNGNTMAVTQNGITIATLTMATGSSATQTVTVCNNVPLTLFWNSGGNFATEVGVSVLNNFGQVIFTRTPGTSGQNTSLYTGTVDCANPACLAPSGLTASGNTQNGATITWGTATTGNWEYYVVPVGSPAPTAATPGIPTTTNSVTLTDLSPSSTYTYYVRMICNSGASQSEWSTGFTFSTLQVPADLNYSDDFETSLSWTLVNGTATNKWVYGTAVSNSPTHSLYISNNNGTSNAYTTSATSIVHAYRDIAVPMGTTEVNLAFDWRNLGEGYTGGAWDYISVYAVPTTYFPAAGTAVAGGTTIANLLWNGSSWANFSSTFNASAYAGGSMRIIFQWRNDSSGGSQPPAAIDNVVLTRITCPQPSTLALVANSVTQESAAASWTELGSATQWEVIVQPATAAAPTAASTGVVVDTPTYTAEGLSPSTAYVFYVRAICADDDKSLWTGPLTFTTTQIPGVVNYTDDFEGDLAWTFVNGTQTNKWAYGTAVSSSPTHSLYVTNNNGTSNAYTTSSTSVVHAYRDIAVPAGYNDVEISFKWRNQGEGYTGGAWDYLTAYVVPTSYVPTAGTTMVGAATGGTQITGLLWNNPNWTTFTSQQNVSAYAGGTMRLVFQWRNDSGGGTQPPAAVDDITVTYVPCAAPSGVTINCLTSEGINLSWNESGNSQWEVVVQPSASAAPTSGTVVNDPNYTYEGALTQGTSYTAYVRAVCADGSGYSGWSTVQFTGPYVSVGGAQALCAGILAVPQQSNSGGTVPAYGSVGCLGSTPNPTWYYVTLGADGAVSLNLSQVSNATGTGIDVDFAIFGPFESKLEACSLLGSPPNTSYMVDCSYSAASVEQIDFSGSAGDVFALLVTNFNGAPGQVTIVQTAGPAVSCNPTVELGADRSFCDTSSYNLTATVDNPGEAQVYTYTWYQDTEPFTPTVVSTTADSQTISVTDEGSHVYSVVVTMPNPTSSDPVTDQVTIALSHPYTAPVYDPIVVCSPTTTADVDIDINYLGTLDLADYTVVGVYPTLMAANAASTVGIDTATLYNTGSTTLYAVIADVLVPTCKKIVPLEITVNQVTGTLAYNDTYCTNDGPAQSGLTQIGGTPGSYVATPDGLTIDATSGEITPATSTPGTYHIVYTIPGDATCAPVDVEDDIEIIAAPVATTIAYPGAYCNTAGTTAVVTITGATGGTFAGDTGLVIDTTTGDVDLGASTPGIHTVTYTIPNNGPCSLPPVTATIEINAQLTGTFDYPRATYCTNEGLVSVTNFVGSVNGMYMATPAGLTINPVTGEIDLASSAAGTYDVVYHFDATASCDAYTSPAVQVTVQQLPVTTVTYDGPYCNTAGVIGTPTIMGTQGGMFSGDTGLVIDGTTGIIDLGTSTAGTHTVTYLPPATGVCVEAAVTVTVEINAQLTGTFDYPRATYCSTEGLVNVTNFVGSTGGMYMATPAGLTIDPATGEIDLASSTAGTYDVVYHFDATSSCLEYTSPAFQITVVTQPVTTIDYGTTPFCNTAGFTATVVINGTPGGLFTATPAGLDIDPTTGEIDLGASTPNTYTVSYAPPATGPCTELPVTATVVINSSLSATIAYPSAVYCSDAGTTLPTHTGDAGGVYEATPAGLVIDADSGEIDLAASTAGVYSITYHILAAGACGDFYSAPVTVEINAAPDPATAISYTDTAFCSDAGLIPVTLTGTTGGTYMATPAGLDIDIDTGEINTTTSAVGVTYEITYTTPSVAPCTPFTTAPVYVTINPLPVASIVYAGSPYCSNGGVATVTLSGSNNANGTYSSSVGLVINGTTGDIDLAASTPGTYDVVYTVTGPTGCGVITSAPTTVVITRLPEPDFTYPALVSCNAPGQPLLTPTYLSTTGGPGTFTVDVPGLTINPATGEIDPVSSAPGTYVITNTIIGTDGCTGSNPASAPVTVVITNAPVADFSYSALAYCQASTTTVGLASSNTLGQFTATPAGLAINASTGDIDVAASTPGIYEVVNTIAATTDCGEITSAPVYVTITAQPVITTVDGCIDNQYTLQVLLDTDPVYGVDDVNIQWTMTTPTGDSIGSEDSVIITNPGTYYVTVTPRTGAVCSAVLPVTVENSMCNIQRGISPGGTVGQNDDFDLRGLDVRKLSIFNRYGKEVYKFEGEYTTQWHGQTANGEDLPTGTYFYMFSRANGENRTGWIYVNREVK